MTNEYKDFHRFLQVAFLFCVICLGYLFIGDTYASLVRAHEKRVAEANQDIYTRMGIIEPAAGDQ